MEFVKLSYSVRDLDVSDGNNSQLMIEDVNIILIKFMNCGNSFIFAQFKDKAKIIFSEFKTKNLINLVLKSPVFNNIKINWEYINSYKNKENIFNTYIKMTKIIKKYCKKTKSQEKYSRNKLI